MGGRHTSSQRSDVGCPRWKWEDILVCSVMSKYNHEILIIHCCNLFGNISRNILCDTTLCSCVLHFYDFITPMGHVSHTFLGGGILKYGSVSCGKSVCKHAYLCVYVCMCTCTCTCMLMQTWIFSYYSSGFSFV